MNSIKKILMAIILLLSVTISSAQIKNGKTETVKIYGNCDMCKSKIETAGTLKKTAKVEWNKDSKMATLTYDSTKTSQDEILKRIALAGYDSDKFLAPDATYDALHGCCQYDREAKVAVSTEMKMETTSTENHANHVNHSDAPVAKQQVDTKLKVVFDTYFLLKDALVKTEGKASATAAKDVLTALNAVKMDELAMDVHMIWMKEMKSLMADAKNISETQDIKRQREIFIPLSKSMYELIKVAKYETPVYLQFCPMANDGKGANWLSKENAVKNPYYGSKMMTCGKTVETIQ
jgi:copper chaperone CopZ